MSTPDETRDIPVTDTAAGDDHEPTLVSVPAVAPGDWDLTSQLPSPGPAPAAEDPDRPPAIACAPCGEPFAHAGFGGRALFLAESLQAAAVAAGWISGEGDPLATWTCTVCQAKAAAGPAPEPQAVTGDPPPDTDPYRQYADMSAELDQDVARFWSGENQTHNAARFRIGMRLHDARILIGELTGVAS